MNAADFEAVTYDGAVYCVGCLPEGLSVDDESVSPVFCGSEWDYYPTCDVCHCEHDYVSLTTDGRIAWSEAHWSPKMRAFSQDCRDHIIPLPAFTPFGSHTMIYVEKSGAEVCAKCAANTEKQLSLVDYGTYDEGPVIECAECGDDIESSYGDPDAPEVAPAK